MKKRNIWIIVTAVVLVLAAVAAAVMIPRMPKEEAAVFPVTMVGYTDYYSGSAESYGLVATDKVQPLYLSESQTVTEILVYPGQSVKKGDVLFTYDTTLSDLAIKRKDLANKQLEAQLKTAQSELTALKKMKPIVYKPSSSGSSSAKTDYSKSPSSKSKLNTVYSTNTSGLFSTRPLYVWLAEKQQVDDEMIGYLFKQADGDPSRIYVVFQTTKNDRANATFDSHFGVSFQKVYEDAPPETAKPTETTVPTQPAETTTPTQPAETTTPTQPAETIAPTQPAETTAPTQTAETIAPTQTAETIAPTQAAMDTAMENETQPATASQPARAQEKVFSGYTMSFFDPPSAPEEDSGTVQWNDGYTSAELTSMRNEKQAEIKQLQFDIKVGKAELKIMQKEAEDGNVLAEFDGVVSEILDPAAALESGEPMMKVTGGGGYYVEGTINELALATLQPGQSVTVNAWDTGMVYTGTVVEIGAYPVEDQNASGTTNASFYPYKVFIDESADLQEGFYVSMTYQTEEQAAGILYLQNAFLRSEGNRTYVYVRGAEDLLEKRYLECGVSTDGYMTPIYSGITEEDYLAFPYGSAITEGAPTFEGTDQDLYGY